MSIVGKPVEEVPTPALLLDLDKMDWNIEKMMGFAREAGVQVRPHAKTFKAAAICNRLLEAGACGVLTQKLGEAEALVNSGILYGDKTLLVSQEIAEPSKLEALVGLSVAMGEGRVLATVDNLQGAERLSQAAEGWGVRQDVVVEVSHGRCGVAPGAEAVKLVKRLARLPGLRFRGIYGYEGPVEAELALRRNRETVETAEAIRREGIEVEIVSAGSTATYMVTGTYPGITEIQPGSFVFGVGPEGSGYGWRSPNGVFFKSSLSVLTQVVGDNFPDRVVTDAGSKALSEGHRGADPVAKVRFEGEPLEVKEVRLSEEHAIIGFEEGSPQRSRIRWGDKLELVPSHCCTAVNQHDEVVVVKGGRVCAVWPVTARGKYR